MVKVRRLNRNKVTTVAPRGQARYPRPGPGG